MDKSRLSARKSEISRGIEDFCLNMPENSDPVISSLLSILEWEASLNIPTTSVLHKIFRSQLQEIKCRLLLQLKTIRKLGDNEGEGHRATMIKHMNEYFKLKQLFSYCFTLLKKKSEINEDVQKFKFYTEREVNLSEELEDYLNEPILFQIIFQSYLKIYSPNIFTADLIEQLAAKHQPTAPRVKQPTPWSNADLEGLSNKNTVFKNLISSNKKYCELEDRLKHSYITFVCRSKKDSESEEPSNSSGNGMSGISSKFQKLSGILTKIKSKHSLGQSSYDYKLGVVMYPEPLCSLDIASPYHGGNQATVEASAKGMLIGLLYEGEDFLEKHESIDFAFMKMKIIRVEVMCLLNRILSAANVLAHWYNELDLGLRSSSKFQFKDLRKLIACEFLSAQLFSSQQCQHVNTALFMSNNSQLRVTEIISSDQEKVLYPTAVYFLYGFAKMLLSIDIRSQGDFLTILQSKAEEMEGLSQTVGSLYQMVKQNELECYESLREYIRILLENSEKLERRSTKSCQSFISAVNYGCQKVKIICQIVYEFNFNYGIAEALQQLIQIEFRCLSGSCSNPLNLYESILDQIIRIHNGLSLDHLYSLSQIQENFSLFPMRGAGLDGDSSDRQLYFQDIIHQVCEASKVNLFLPKLFQFFDLQSRLTRTVFKLQLSWPSNKEALYERKVAVFKDLLSTYTSPILTIISNSTSILSIILKSDQIERQITLLDKEVKHFTLVDKFIQPHSDSNCGISLSREHLNRLSLETLEEIDIGMNVFNPIQSHHCPPKTLFYQEISANIAQFSTIRIEEMKVCKPHQMKQKERIASIINFICLLPARNKEQDYQNILHFYFNRPISYDLFQLKEKEIALKAYSQVLSSPDINALTEYYEALMVLGLVMTLREVSLEGHKKEQRDLQRLLELFRFSEIFTNLKRIKEVEFWRKEFGIMSKFHYVYQIINSIAFFEARAYNEQLSFQEKKKNGIPSNCFFYKKIKLLTIFYYLFEIRVLTRLKLQKNLQLIEMSIDTQEPVDKNPKLYVAKIKNLMYQEFCQELCRTIDSCEDAYDLGIRLDGGKSSCEYIEQLRKIMLKLVSEERILASPHNSGKVNELQFFGEKKGFEVEVREVKSGKKNPVKRDRSKKGVISAPHSLLGNSHMANPLAFNLRIDILKKTMSIRKQISALQIKQKKIGDDIMWETSKLEHNVIEKINHFIALSHVDEQQSYINFKHTVNLETIKGIENVIEEQTEMYMEKKNSKVRVASPQKECGEGESGESKGRLLEVNIEAIMEHLYKIKVFAAWKKSLKRADLTKFEWGNFDKNAEKILESKPLQQSLREIEKLRLQYLEENVSCEIMRDENKLLNDRIEDLKIRNLEKKVSKYRDKLLNC